MQTLNRRFVSSRGNQVQVWTTHALGRRNGFVGRAALVRTVAVVNGNVSVLCGASFQADAAVRAAGF